MHLNASHFLDQAKKLVKEARNENANYTAELDRSRPVKKGAARRRRHGEQVAVNMYMMGTSFIGNCEENNF